MRFATPRIVFSKGVLDREAAFRFDLEPYYQAALDAENAIPQPLGGFDQRGGLPTRARVRRMLRQLSLTAAMVTAPRGGVPANLVDQSTSTELRTTSNANTATPFVVAQIDLGSVREIAFADARSFSCSTGSGFQCFRCQTSLDGVAWVDLGVPVNIATTGRTRRFAAGAGLVRAARYVRFAVTGQPVIGTVGIREARIFVETGRVSVVRRFNFTFSVGETYTMLATDRNVDVFRSGVWVASVPIPHRSDQLEIVTRSQRDDTIIFWHPEVAPHALFRQGANTEWDSYAQTFSNVPTFSGGTQFGAAQHEIQEVVLEGVADGDQLQVVIEDMVTVLVPKSQVPATLAAALKTAIEDLPNVDAGIGLTVSEASVSRVVFRVEFLGGANTGRSWPAVWVDNHSRDTADVAVSVLQDGRSSSGLLMGSAVGWPRCGVFFQSRLIVAGFKQSPSAYAASVVTDFFNFNQPSALTPTSGFDDALDTDEVAAIHHVYAGRHLQFFTENSEWYCADRVLDATQTRNLVQATRNGCRAGVEPIQAEGGTQFVQGLTDLDAGVVKGVALRDFLYTDNGVEVAYTSDSLTVLSSGLAGDIVDVAYRRAADPRKANEIYIVNADGTAAMLTLLRREKVQALVPLKTDGKFRQFAVDGARRVFAVVERVANGSIDNWYEEFDSASFLDASFKTTPAPGQTVIPCPERLEGKSVWVIADGEELGPYTVAGGEITLARPVQSGAIEVGLYFAWRVETMPLRPVTQSGQVDMSPHRIHTVTVEVLAGSSLAVAANGTPPQEVPLRRFGDDLDQPLIKYPASGSYRVEGLEGKIVGATAVLTRPRPGPIRIAGLFMEAA